MKLVVLVGLPASGKSTWLKENGPTDYILSTDDIVEHIASRYGFTYDEAYSHLIPFATKAFYKQADNALASRQDIYVDQTNLTLGKRAYWIKRAKANGYVVGFKYFPKPDNWEERLVSRPGKTIPRHVLKQMQKVFEEPCISEGFDFEE